MLIRRVGTDDEEIGTRRQLAVAGSGGQHRDISGLDF
jgi:hypothetical protein